MQTAPQFLELMQKKSFLLRFLDRERGYLIADLDETANSQLEWPNFDADEADMIVFTLKSNRVANEYYKQHPNMDFTKDGMWRVRENRGVNSQGKLPEFAREQGYKYTTLRDIITLVQKRRVIEAEMKSPGLADALFFVSKKLKLLRFEEIGPFCTLLRDSPLLPVLLHAAVKISKLSNDHAYLVRLSESR